MFLRPVLRTTLALIYFVALGFALAACSKTENKQATAPAASPPPPEIERQRSLAEDKALPANVVEVKTSSVNLFPGRKGEASVRLAIANGYHINANPPSFSYLKATELTVAPVKGFTVGQPVYPTAITKKFAFAEQPLAVYEGEAIIKLPLTADAKDTPYGEHGLSDKLRYQACDEQACYPPRTLDISISVVVK